MFEVLHSRNEPVGRAAYAHADPRTAVCSLDVLRALRDSRQAARPLTLQVQWPERVDSDAYLAGLNREIDLVGCHLSRQQRVEQLHLAGATPAPTDVRRLMAQLRRRLNLLAQASSDYSVDVDLLRTDWASMGVLRELGFSRVSLGVPDSGSALEASPARYRNPAPIHSLIDAARTFGYRSVSVDLGYGRAWQTPRSFSRKLSALIDLAPDRLQVFDYAQPPQRYARSSRQAASNPQDTALMRRICFEQLPAAGYQYLGQGLFVRCDDDLAIAREHGELRRTCRGFTRHGDCDHVGLGLGAVSQFAALSAQNTEVLGDYFEHLQRGQLPTWHGPFATQEWCDARY